MINAQGLEEAGVDGGGIFRYAATSIIVLKVIKGSLSRISGISLNSEST